MNRLAILSRDADQYHALLTQAALPKLDIVVATQSWSDSDALRQAELMLADPDLIAPNLADCPNLQWLQSTWAGVKPVIDSRAGQKAADGQAKSDVLFTGVKDVFGPQMREFVFAYLLHFSRDVARFDALKKQQNWQAPDLVGLAGKTLGIMGVGSIGQAVAKMARSFDMRVLGLTYNSRDCEDVDEYFGIHSASEFAAQLDYLVCLLPHTTNTENLINRAFLKALPKHTVLINAGRGQAIDDEALIDALNAGELSAAVLDVFREEPLHEDHPYWHHPKVHITQHTAAISRPQDIAKLFADNYNRYHHQQPLHYQIDWQKGY